MPDKRLIIRAARYDPEKDEKPRMQEYDVPLYDESMVVLDAPVPTARWSGREPLSPSVLRR